MPKNKKLVEKYDPVFRQMVGSVNGRVYYKISNWYTVLKFLPLSKNYSHMAGNDGGIH